MNVHHLFKSPLKGGFQLPSNCLWVHQGNIVEDRILAIRRAEGAAPDGNEFLSMRYTPRMTRILQAIRHDSIVLYERGQTCPNSRTVVDLKKTGNKARIKIWDKQDPEDRFALECESKNSDWLSRFLGQKVTLLQRDIDNLKSRDVNGKDMKVAFQDSSAIHAVTLSSLKSLALNEPTEITARRFRPNIVIDTNLPAYAEDDWDGKTVKIERREYHVQKCTVRCHVPYLNPLTGKPTSGLREELESVRKFNEEVLFGLYLFPLFDGIGTIETGDKVTVS